MSKYNQNDPRMHFVPRFLPAVLGLIMLGVYALTLNRLPPRYVQKGTIILREPLTDEEIRREIRQAVEQVEKNPTCCK